MGLWKVWHPKYGVVYDELGVIKGGDMNRPGKEPMPKGAKFKNSHMSRLKHLYSDRGRDQIPPDLVAECFAVRYVQSSNNLYQRLSITGRLLLTPRLQGFQRGDA
jgi:hypothetical protein